MENDRNNILENFRYGFCDLSGETSSVKELESQLGWNEEAIGLLTEIYPIVGKINLDLAEERKSTIVIEENDNSLREVRPMEALNELSDYNDIVVELRKLLYSEIELSNYKILDEEYDEKASNLLFELGLELTNFFEKSFSETIWDAYQRFDMAAKLLYESGSLRVRELVNFIEDQISRIDYWISPYSGLEQVIKCLEAIKNSGLAAKADRLWNTFLLKLYSSVLFGDELNGFQGIDLRFDNNEYEHIVRSSYRKIDDSLQRLQHHNIQNMLMLYSLDRLSSGTFYNRDVIRQLYHALNSSEDLRERYLITVKNNGEKTQNPKGKKNSSNKCFAAMYNRDTKKKYAALSGVFDAERYIYPGVTTTGQKNESLRRKNKYNDLVSLLKNILGNSYEVIDSDDDVKYYYKKGGKMKNVTAKKFISYPYPVDKRPGNRMFSCCERKLSTKLVPGCEHDFYVKYAPCTLCDRMITEETRHNKHFIHVFCAGKITDISKDKIVEYDKSADAVK